jgi:hypothetical protein
VAACSHTRLGLAEAAPRSYRPKYRKSSVRGAGSVLRFGQSGSARGRDTRAGRLIKTRSSNQRPGPPLGTSRSDLPSFLLQLAAPRYGMVWCPSYPPSAPEALLRVVASSPRCAGNLPHNLWLSDTPTNRLLKTEEGASIMARAPGCKS